MDFLLQEPFLFSVTLFVVGCIAGFINVMAGGGSVLTLGSMILMGVDPQVANGTNRVALVAESVSAIIAFKKKLKNDVFESVKLSLWTIPGALFGAFFAIEIPDQWFQRILVLVIIFVIITILIPLKLPAEKSEKNYSPAFYASLIFTGFYGGFIQAGIGFVVMICFRQLAGMKLLEINIHKVFLVLIYTLPVLTIFIWSGNINWTYALWLGAGNFIGAWWSASVSVKRGEKAIKVVVSVAMMIMATKLLLDTL
ncbi:sulfite exporter TauE/SafE family protein [Litoribrevibacter euphylliae]|uniref:Probable membrane transporter protein n=1 Tax=Litoribrevibacter euphylliae TaxID=1834034 RepID=A0ABV7HGH7_9GAMM